MIRPAVDVVVPFAGSEAELADLLRRLEVLELRAEDTLTVVDNHRRGVTPRQTEDSAAIVAAHELRSSYYARNRGAARGQAPWIVFIDADVDPAPDLLGRYFDEEPGGDVALLAGRIDDAPLGRAPTRAERFAAEHEQMSQANTMRGVWAYAQTANVAVRRSAFEAIGGFTDALRSGGDADLSFRLRAAGWRLEERPRARVVHHNRRSARAFLRQKARHGAGAAWLNRRYPGSFPPRGRAGYLKWLVGELVRAAGTTLRGSPREAADRLFPALVIGALELGRLLPNRVRTR